MLYIARYMYAYSILTNQYHLLSPFSHPQWDRRLCTEDEILRLIHHHDYHHRAFKKFVAQNRPSDFQTVNKLLSYAGFLRCVCVCVYVHVCMCVCVYVHVCVCVCLPACLPASL